MFCAGTAVESGLVCDSYRVSTVQMATDTEKPTSSRDGSESPNDLAEKKDEGSIKDTIHTVIAGVNYHF